MDLPYSYSFPTTTSASSAAQANVTRVLGTAFQPNLTRWTHGKYSVQITVTASITGGQNGDIFLEIADDSGFTTNVVTLDVMGVGQVYTLALALQGVQPQSCAVSGWIPPGKWARLRTAQNTGAPTFAYRNGQELTM